MGNLARAGPGRAPVAHYSHSFVHRLERQSRRHSAYFETSYLLALIAEARRLVPDDRHIWCYASETFESRITQRRGVLLGGAFSPHFLRDTTAMSWDVPWTVRLRHCRVLICDKRAADEPLTAWLPLMESVAGAGEALLVVTETIGSELLSTFVVNAFKGTLPVCV